MTRLRRYAALLDLRASWPAFVCFLVLSALPALALLAVRR